MSEVPNPQLQLAHDFVEYTGRNVFLTGKAGTGKTTFLHKLKMHSPKRMIVVAPTGVAAINAGGVTIHSFFQLSFGPQIPNSNSGENGQNAATAKRFSREKINIIRSLDLLVIDEISMVRADLLDGIDEVLRRFRNRDKPFGGVQLLMIGDLQQLSPVVKDDEWELLKPYYETIYFFSSRALRQTQFVSIELKHIYRQSDHVFIDMLNKIRENRIDEGRRVRRVDTASGGMCRYDSSASGSPLLLASAGTVSSGVAGTMSPWLAIVLSIQTSSAMMPRAKSAFGSKLPAVATPAHAKASAATARPWASASPSATMRRTRPKMVVPSPGLMYNVGCM